MAVNRRYSEIIEDVFARQPNTRLYREIASAINTARKGLQ